MYDVSSNIMRDKVKNFNFFKLKNIESLYKFRKTGGISVGRGTVLRGGVSINQRTRLTSPTGSSLSYLEQRKDQ